MLSEQSDFLGSVNYSTSSIDKQKEKINLYAFFAVIYSLFIMLEGQSFHVDFIGNLKYDLGIYANLNNDTFNYDALLFGSFVVCALVIFFFTKFIRGKFSNWVIDGIEKQIKKSSHTSPKPKAKPKPKSNTQKKPTTKIDSSQYSINSNMSKQEIKKILNREFQKWHNASRSPNTEIVKKARMHKKNIASLRKELL